MSNNAEFARKGCASACHNQADDEATWYMGTDGETIQLDQWHWKSARVPPRPVPFGVSLIDDGGGLDHTNAPDVITLDWN